MRRVVTLPSEGRLIVATDLQGNLRDLERVIEIFEAATLEPGGAFLVVTGDLVHGPELEPADWPEHLGTFYKGDSPAVVARARELADAHPGRVHFLLGNHEHAHVGGPIVSKFFPDEAERLEGLLGEGDTELLRDWIRSWPFVAIAPSAGIAMTHAAPHALIRGPGDLEALDLELDPEANVDLDGRSILLALLWARTTSAERARQFLAALDPRLAVAVYGHDVAHTGYAIDREPLLCVSTSFGCHDGDKLYLSWDLGRPASSAREVAEEGLLPLYPDAAPVHRVAVTP
ncbi:MAG TPA: metallophosphoesterase [Polyangiaceae bacterium]|nr:metallophosphoesterase [Polyangiaceae bacterium]